MAKWSDKVYAVVAMPFRALSRDQRFWLGFAIVCLITTLLIDNPLWRASSEHVYKEGDIVRESIIAPSDVFFSDTDDTEKRRAEARDQTKPIFRYESKKSETAVQTFLSAWEKLQRRGIGEASNSKPANSTTKPETFWTGAGGVEVGKIFAARTFSRNELEAVQSALRESSEGYIYDDVDRQYFQNEVVVLDRSRPNLQSRVTMPESNWTQLSTAREKLKTRINAVKSLSQSEANAFYTATEILVEPSITYDSVATEAAKTTAAESVPAKIITLKRGQKIANDGDIVSPDLLSKLAAMHEYSSSSRQLNRFFGLLIFITSLFWAAWKFIEHRGLLPRLALTAEKTFVLFGFIVLVQTAVMAVFFRLADFTALQNIRAPLSDPMLWSFAIPFATGSLLMTLLADRPTALFTGLFTSFLAGFLAPRGLEFATFAALASAVAVYGIGRYRSRQTVTVAGALVGAASAILALAMIAYTQQLFSLNTVLLAIACSLASGIFTAAATALLLPICENFFGILTDVKLLELSNADLPVLGQLAMRAPGTNQHSHAVGQLAEDACRVVGGNALLTRIGALYHDIGKTAAPEHFVENQLAKNPHDTLKPMQSAKIIISHVTYGTKLAKEMGLPQRIID